MNKLARNTLALGTATMIVTAGISFSATAADPIIAQAEASAITSTGLTSIVDTSECRVESTGAPTNGTAPTCDLGLTTQGAGVFGQNAFTGLSGDKGTSTGLAAVAPINIPALTTIDLSTIPADLSNIDTATVLDPLIDGLGPVLTGTLNTALGLAGLTLDQLLAQIQTAAITPITTALQGAIPVAVEIGAVTSSCTVTAGGAPSLASEVAGINIVVGPNRELVVPVNVGTTPNLPLVGSVAVQQLVDDAFDGIEATLNQSLGGALGPLADVLPTVQATLVDAVLDGLAPVVDQLGQAVVPIIDGTLNKQTLVPAGSGEVTALDLNVIGSTATLDLARSQCGPNGVRTVVTPPTPTPPSDDAPADDGPVNNDDTNSDDSDSVADGTDADGDDSDTVADADAQADADVTTSLPAAGAPNLLPFWLLGIALLLFGGAVLLNEKRRLNQI